jgi:phage terminase large subunit
LREWSYEWNEDLLAFSKDPLHNWASHPGDGYSYGCQVMEERLPEKPAPEPMRGVMVGPQNKTTLEDMYADTKRERYNRI